ncbi:MAG: hypothetical protein HOI19_12315, partial [Rhodospirillaceae bacterium]|nr:hypothetical protein [Rhodospirillaceae bacterium]
ENTEHEKAWLIVVAGNVCRDMLKRSERKNVRLGDMQIPQESAEQSSELIDASRANLQSQNRIHAAVIALLSSRSLDHMLEILTIDLAGLLHVDAVAGPGQA